MSKIMGTSVPCAELDAVFTMQELKDAIFESPVDRAPGGFFKTSWNVIKEDLLRALNKF
jgi:hypothetical protein